MKYLLQATNHFLENQGKTAISVLLKDCTQVIFLSHRDFFRDLRKQKHPNYFTKLVLLEIFRLPSAAGCSPQIQDILSLFSSSFYSLKPQQASVDTGGTLICCVFRPPLQVCFLQVFFSAASRGRYTPSYDVRSRAERHRGGRSPGGRRQARTRGADLLLKPSFSWGKTRTKDLYSVRTGTTWSHRPQPHRRVKDLKQIKSIWKCIHWYIKGLYYAFYFSAHKICVKPLFSHTWGFFKIYLFIFIFQDEWMRWYTLTLEDCSDSLWHDTVG